MKKNAFAGGLLALLMLSPFVLESFAADLANGRKVFQANCAGCHKNGGNVVARDKTLQKEALLKYNHSSPQAIQKQVAEGHGKMPAFKNLLSPAQIEDVAAYVLDQAAQGW